MRFLLTGFAPFGHSSVNPSWDAVQRIPDVLGDHTIVRLELPVEYGRAGEILLEAIAAYAPDCVLCIGQAAGRAEISLESTAVNLRSSASPDNAGVIYQGERADPTGAESMTTNLPLRELLDILSEADVRAKISYSAGTYVCNDVYYALLRYIEETPGLYGGFIHIPAEEGQAADFPAGTPLMPLSEVVRAIKVVIAYMGR